MSILNVNQIQPVGSGQTVTISATNIDAGSATVTAGTFSGGVTVTSGNLTGITSVSTSNLTVNGNAYPSAGPLSNRNMLYNGAMVVNQRGYTSAASTTTGYSVDRWNYDHNSDSVVAVGQSTSAAAQPTGQGFTNSLHVRVTTADNSLGASQYARIRQKIEGYDVQSIKKGSSNAEPLTLSFWVRSSKTGTYICEVFDTDNTRQCSKSYTIDAANTWEKKILTFPADTTGAFDNDNAESLVVNWWLASGSTWTSGTLNTSWATNTNANRVVGQVNFLDTAGAQFNITGVQLEVGSVATPFEHRSYGDELARCQRYYLKSGPKGDGTTPAYASHGLASVFDSDSVDLIVHFPVTMRAAPTASFSNIAAFRGSSSSTVIAMTDAGSTAGIGFYRTDTGSHGYSIGDCSVLLNNNNTSGYIQYSAEL
jgi:hypothetical protein